MKEVFDRYSAKAPQPLNTEFTDQLGKDAAVKAYEERIQKQKTSLFPPSRCFGHVWLTTVLN